MSMKKLLDLGFMIGLFFLITGVILVIGALFSAGELSKKINIYCGLGYIVFAMIMMIFSAYKIKSDYN